MFDNTDRETAPWTLRSAGAAPGAGFVPFDDQADWEEDCDLDGLRPTYEALPCASGVREVITTTRELEANRRLSHLGEGRKKAS